MLSASSLLFTAANWNVPQTVTVTGVADGILDGDIPYSTIIGAAISTDAEYSGLDPADIALVNVDNDVAGFVYWSDGTGDTIQRARLSGAQPEALVDLKKAFGDTVNYATRGTAVNLVAGKVYWTETATHAIYRANVDGFSVEPIISTPAACPYGDRRRHGDGQNLLGGCQRQHDSTRKPGRHKRRGARQRAFGQRFGACP